MLTLGEVRPGLDCIAQAKVTTGAMDEEITRNEQIAIDGIIAAVEANDSKTLKSFVSDLLSVWEAILLLMARISKDVSTLSIVVNETGLILALEALKYVDSNFRNYVFDYNRLVWLSLNLTPAALAKVGQEPLSPEQVGRILCIMSNRCRHKVMELERLDVLARTIKRVFEAVGFRPRLLVVIKHVSFKYDSFPIYTEACNRLGQTGVSSADMDQIKHYNCTGIYGSSLRE